MAGKKPFIARIAGVLVLLAAGASSARGQECSDRRKLVAAVREDSSNFGESVAVSSGTLLVGEPQRCTTPSECGFAHVFVLSGGVWTEQAELVPATRTDGGFGTAVSLSGDSALVSDPVAESAYVFVRSGTIWSQEQQLVPSDAGEAIGIWSVAIDGDTALIGAPLVDCAVGGDCGAVYVFVRSAGTWTEEAKLTPADPGTQQRFGESVSLSGDTALIGAYYGEAAYVFERDGLTWSQQAKLVASDAGGVDQFGFQVSVSDDTAFVAARLRGCASGMACGAVHEFTRSGSVWTEQQILTASDASAGFVFGSSVEVWEDMAIIGSDGADGQGAAYLFNRTATGWIEAEKLVSEDPLAGDAFGFSVAIDDGVVVVGEIEDDCPAGRECGAAFAFSCPPPVLSDYWQPGDAGCWEEQGGVEFHTCWTRKDAATAVNLYRTSCADPTLAESTWCAQPNVAENPGAPTQDQWIRVIDDDVVGAPACALYILTNVVDGEEQHVGRDSNGLRRPAPLPPCP